MRRIVVLFIVFVMLAAFSNSVQAQILDSPPRDGVFEKIHTQARKPIPYVPVREADVTWSKRIWRIIDLRQKINQPFYFPEEPQSGWRNLMHVIIDALREGTLTAYDPTADDQFLVPMTFQEIENKYSSVDTTPILDPENPQRILRYEITTESLKTTDVKTVQIKEDWFFDKQRSVMEVRIIGLCPELDLYNNSGVYLGKNKLFWIYFPEARPVFANAEVFNMHNGSERRTYDDVFWKRKFGSYIIKEENVYDRSIRDYSTGMDALLESERIKNDLFEFEHDLWEF
jgi:gliding motility associated protien GldN